MTHSLHRCGKIQDKDFVWLLYHVKGVNDQNLVERLRKAIGIIEEVGAVNWGDVKSGPIVSVAPAEIKQNLTEKSRIRGVFTSRGQVTEFLKKIERREVNLLPFHRLGTSKYEQLGIAYLYKNVRLHSAEKLNQIKKIFEQQGISCYVGSDTPF